MFCALAKGKFDTAPEKYEHVLADIETLNRAALQGEYEVTALSFHGYAYVTDKYVLLPHGASMGDGYGPILVAREYTGKERTPMPNIRKWLRDKTIAIPGKRTSAFLALQLLGGVSHRPGESRREPFIPVAVPFDQILPKVAAGEYDGGLIIHEGQLTYYEKEAGGLKKVMDLGQRWKSLKKLPLPLGGNAIRRDLGPERMHRISGHLRHSIKWALEHREESLDYAMQFARNVSREKADKFVGMYVNEYTLDYGRTGQIAVRRFLFDAARQGLVPEDVWPEWVE
jgi:1,4-dihydroxy-6-naphthoate synthase